MRIDINKEQLRVLDEAVELADPSIIELAHIISYIIKEDYGEHTFKTFKDIINEELK